MKTFAVIAALTLATMPALAGDIHGKVAAHGVRNSADAVVYVDHIAGKTFAPPAEHAKVDQ